MTPSAKTKLATSAEDCDEAGCRETNETLLSPSTIKSGLINLSNPTTTTTTTTSEICPHPALPPTTTLEHHNAVGGQIDESRYAVEDASFLQSLLLDSGKHWPSSSNWSLAKTGNNNNRAPPLFRYRHARFSSRRVRRRVVFKHGDCNVVQGNVAKRRRRYLQDIFTTLVDAQWRWTLLVFALNFILSWLGFAVVWCLIVRTHGDLEDEIMNNKTWIPCVQGVRSFSSCFLFSVETQHTIGYGAKHVTDECPEAIFVLCLQSITGVMIQAFMVGVVFAKLSRPKKRTQTLLFSRNAVICQRDGELCLMFRVGDMRKSHIIEAHVRAQLIKKKITREGEVLPFFQQELKVGGDGVEERIFFIWPTTIVHKIVPSSPLYRISAADMLHEKFEIVVILEGVIESTGMTTQARSSYLPSEILWGHRFATLVSFKRETGEHEVDYGLFNNTYEVDTPLCSAYSLDQFLSGHHNTDMNKYISLEGESITDVGGSEGGILITPAGSMQRLAAVPTLNNDDDDDDGDDNAKRSSCNSITVLMPQLSAGMIMRLPEDIPGPESDI